MLVRIFVTFAAAWLMLPATVGASPERVLRLPIVGRATAYMPVHAPDAVVLFISGDGGWNRGVVDMARRLATHAVVVGISFPGLRGAVADQAACWYAAGDLEVIARNAEKQLDLPEYRPPILVGYSSGATLAYAALAAAPAGTFAGAVSLGFCPDLEVPRRLCVADGWKPAFDDRKHVSWLPARTALGGDWYVLHGTQDRVCDVGATRAFVGAMPRAHLIEIDKTGHGFSKPAQWGQQFDQAIAALSRPARTTPASGPASFAAITRELEALDLPLEFSIPAAPRAFFVFVSGDGGWAALDRGVADALARDGIGVIGWSAIRYFWRAKTPQQVAADLARVVTVLERAGKPIAVGGYSFGAEVVPVALASSSRAERRSITSIVAIAPAPTASFEIDPLDWFRTASATPYRVASALASLDIPVLCVRPADDRDTGCADLPRRAGRVITLPGSHHFNGRYGDVATAIQQFIDNGITSPS